MSKIILVGPSAAGKTYLSEKLQKSGFKLEISYTTRPMREGEKEGIDYQFISIDEFEKMIKYGYMYEYTKYGENYYGTSVRDFVESDIFVWETEGVSKIKSEDRPKCTIIYVNTKEAIRISRMIDRGWDNNMINKRLEIDKKLFENFTDYDVEIASETLR